MTTLIEEMVGDLSDKRRWQQYVEVERDINYGRDRLVNAVERAEADDGGIRS